MRRKTKEKPAGRKAPRKYDLKDAEGLSCHFSSYHCYRSIVVLCNNDNENRKEIPVTEDNGKNMCMHTYKFQNC